MVLDDEGHVSHLRSVRMQDVYTAHLHAIGIDPLQLLLLKRPFQPLHVVLVYSFHFCIYAFLLLEDGVVFLLCPKLAWNYIKARFLMAALR